MTGRPRMRPGEGITGPPAASRAPVMIAAQAHPRRALQGVPEPARGQYESILAVPILAARARRRAERAHPMSRASSRREIELLLAIAAQVAQTIEHAKLYARPQRRVVELEAWRGSPEAVSESLYLEESLEGSSRHGRRARRDRRGARARGRRDRLAGGPRGRARGAPAAALEAAARSASSSATATRRSPTTTARCSRRSRTTRRSRSSTGAR
jgi:hypothetical protein